VLAIRALVDALDAHIPDPARDEASPFLMPIEDVFTIGGRGTVVTGRVARGVCAVGEAVEIVGRDGALVVTGVQSFHRDRPAARAGENVGLLIRGLRRDEVERGQVVTAPGAIRPHVAGEAELYVLTAREGGRHTPFRSGYTPQFFFGATDVTGTIATTDDVQPGDRVRVTFRFIRPVGVEPGMRFALREGGRTIGAGLVTTITD
jgi:elongation factor Tu